VGKDENCNLWQVVNLLKLMMGATGIEPMTYRVKAKAASPATKADYDGAGNLPNIPSLRAARNTH